MVLQDKHEWRKKEKALYLPKNKPEVIDIPEFKFITIEGAQIHEKLHQQIHLKKRYRTSIEK